MHLEEDDLFAEALERKDSGLMLKSDVSIDGVTFMGSKTTTGVEESAVFGIPCESDGANIVLELRGDIVATVVRASDNLCITEEGGFREECCDGSEPC